MMITLIICVAFCKGFVLAEVVLSPSTTVVSENTSVTLTCTYSGDETVTTVNWQHRNRPEVTYNQIGVITAECLTFVININTSLYNYTCPNKTQYTWTIRKVTRQNDGDKYKCIVDTTKQSIHSNGATIFVQVPIKSVTMVKPISPSVTVNENTAVEFTCQTSGGIPAAIVTWYRGSGTSGDSSADLEITSGFKSTETSTNSLIEVTSILNYSPSRNDTGSRIYCTASNVAVQTPIVSGSKPLLNVLYPPDSLVITGYTDGDEYRVIENTQGHLSCTVTGGNPAPVLTWNCINSGVLGTSRIGIVTKTHTWIAQQQNQDRTCTCKSSHYSGDKTVSIKIEVLYPPETPTFRIKSNTVSDTVNVIRNNHFSVSCISSGNPSPNYTWTYPDMTTTNGQELSVNNVQNNETYTCNVRNSMDSSDGAVVPGNNTSFIDVLILYPPLIGNLKNKSVAEGSQVTVSCPVTYGFPSQTTYEWIRDGAVWKRTQAFAIDSTSRNDAMVYTCKVSNRMQQTGEQPVSQPDMKSFYLNVWYGASVKEYFIAGHKGEKTVVVNENDTVPFNCKVDSNPGSEISVYYQKNVLKSLTDTKSLVYTIPSATCTDRGDYSCIGFNDYNENHSSHLLSLLVKCSPRPSPTVTLEQNVTSAQHKPAVLTFTTLAYPEPNNDDFKWYRLDSNVWQLLSNSGEYNVETSNGQTNLTVKNVNRTYYGMYRLNISNEVGNYSQLFYLEPEDIPDPPTQFRHVEELVTKTSVTLQWKPGFDNGPDQTFILRYKKVSDNDWTSVYIPDTGEEVMNYNITNLTRGTEYEVVLQAFNMLGNSSVTKTLKVKTIEDISTPTNLGLILGVVFGVVAIFVLSLVGFLIARKLRNGKAKDRREVELNGRHMDDPNEDSSDDEVVTENAMYESASNVGQKKLVDDNVYAKPQKKPVANADVYAFVNKTKKQDKKKKQKSHQKKENIGDIYENAPDTAVSKEKTYANSAYDENPYEAPDQASAKRPKKNADGLIYADLTFNDQPKGQKKLVIHGLDSMTEYVEVDFTKKADPLPDSDTEDQK